MARWAEWSDLPGLECTMTEKMLTYNNVRDLARRFGAQLVPNCPEFGLILLGSLWVGVTVVPISPLLTSPEVSRILDIARPHLGGGGGGCVWLDCLLSPLSRTSPLSSYYSDLQPPSFIISLSW